jgi:hypothetical protein
MGLVCDARVGLSRGSGDRYGQIRDPPDDRTRLPAQPLRLRRVPMTRRLGNWADVHVPRSAMRTVRVRALLAASLWFRRLSGLCSRLAREDC